MKYFFSAVLLTALSLSVCFSKTPEELQGIWQGDDRIVFFGSENQFSVILKLYYGWYYDSAAVSEPEKPFRKNAASSVQPQEIHVEFERLSENAPAYEITVIYDKKTMSKIPVAVLDDGLYLDFMIRNDQKEAGVTADSNAGINGTAENADENSVFSQEAAAPFINGFWQGITAKSTIRISPEKNRGQLFSWYITDDAAYRLTFWQTDMDADEAAQAVFSDGERIFTIKKFISSGGENYTCATGRRTLIRNIEKFPEYAKEITTDRTGTILVSGKPAFTRADETSKAEIENIVRQANARRKPDPPPLFEPKELDWHWDLINQLEKGNKIIEEVRERQRAFGPRAQDIEGKK